ncbi:ATP-binding protein [bacterium]|nr:ATP-binding protein [bacterium]
MQRDIEDKLIAWMKAKSRKPLIIRGARQVGKTYTIQEFGKKHFTNLVTIDFERNRSVHKAFQKDLDPKKILQELEFYAEEKIEPGQTLLFFDEIQACEDALQSIRYFYEELPSLHLISAGSLLEFSLTTSSFPVGRVSFEWLHPMTFREVLQASRKEILLQNLPSVFSSSPIPSEMLHQKMMEELKRYMIIGGMPEVVKTYLETGSLAKVKRVQDEIVQSYLESFKKYKQKANMGNLEQLMKKIPSLVGNQVKYTHLDPDRRVETTKSSLHLLEKALLIHFIRSTNLSGLPLGSSASKKVFKLLFLDIGLLQQISGFDPLNILEASDLTALYQGTLAEQFVGQELLAYGGSENSKLYYWHRDKKGSSAEIDYVIVRNGKILPVEVKSGNAGKMRSMHQLMAENTHIHQGLILNSHAPKEQKDQNLIFMPLYASLVC